MAELNIATRDLQLEILAKLDGLPLVRDPFGAPGPQMLSSGTLERGYFGFVHIDELISGNSLASSIGLSAGTAQNSDAGWLKWAKNGKVLFTSKKPLRHSISWDNINAVGAVFGAKTVVIHGKTYKVRLLTGGEANLASVAGGEWNDIMYGVHQDMLPPWDNFSDADIVVTAGNGRYSWCQETSSSNSSNRVGRGSSGVTYFSTYAAASGTNDSFGWRPVLELVQ